MMVDIFSKEGAKQMVERVEQLTTDTQPKWGTMSVAQMLAHLNVPYDMAFTDKYQRPNAFMRVMLKVMVKNMVVSEKPYKKNLRTAPTMVIADEREFEKEQKQLIRYIQKTQQLGTSHFEGKMSLSFGTLTAQQWNNLFSKHLDHHLSQFGV